MTTFKTEVPEGMIRDAIAVAISETFTDEKRDSLLRDIVRAHLSYRESTWDKETLLSKAIGTQIRSIAMDEVKNVVLRLEPQIRKIVSDSLGTRFSGSILEQLANAVSHSIVANITLTAKLEDE